MEPVQPPLLARFISWTEQSRRGPPAPGLGGPMQPPDLHVSFHGLSNPRRGPPTPGLGGPMQPPDLHDSFHGLSNHGGDRRLQGWMDPVQPPLLAPFISWVEQSRLQRLGKNRTELTMRVAVQCKPRARISDSTGDARFRRSSRRVRKVPAPPERWRRRAHRRS
jgi:hypothetical protein